MKKVILSFTVVICMFFVVSTSEAQEHLNQSLKCDTVSAYTDDGEEKTVIICNDIHSAEEEFPFVTNLTPLEGSKIIVNGREVTSRGCGYQHKNNDDNAEGNPDPPVDLPCGGHIWRDVNGPFSVTTTGQSKYSGRARTQAVEECLTQLAGQASSQHPITCPYYCPPLKPLGDCAPWELIIDEDTNGVDYQPPWDNDTAPGCKWVDSPGMTLTSIFTLIPMGTGWWECTVTCSADSVPLHQGCTDCWAEAVESGF